MDPDFIECEKENCANPQAGGLPYCSKHYHLALMTPMEREA